MASSAAQIVETPFPTATEPHRGRHSDDGAHPKRLELLHAAAPGATLVAALDSPASFNAIPAAHATRAIAAAAASLGVRLVTFEANKEADFDGAVGQIRASGAGAMLVMASPFLFAQHRRVVAFANTHRLPAIYEWGEIARNGRLMAYGDSIAALYRRAGDYVGRVLKGGQTRGPPDRLAAGDRPYDQPQDGERNRIQLRRGFATAPTRSSSEAAHPSVRHCRRARYRAGAG